MLFKYQIPNERTWRVLILMDDIPLHEFPSRSDAVRWFIISHAYFSFLFSFLRRENEFGSAARTFVLRASPGGRETRPPWTSSLKPSRLQTVNESVRPLRYILIYSVTASAQGKIGRSNRFLFCASRKIPNRFYQSNNIINAMTINNNE